MQLINIGFGNMVSSARLLAIVSPDSAPIKRMIQEAKDRGMLIDASFGRLPGGGVHGVCEAALRPGHHPGRPLQPGGLPRGLPVDFPPVRRGIPCETFCQRACDLTAGSLWRGSMFRIPSRFGKAGPIFRRYEFAWAVRNRPASSAGASGRPHPTAPLRSAGKFLFTFWGSGATISPMLGKELRLCRGLSAF